MSLKSALRGLLVASLLVHHCRYSIGSDSRADGYGLLERYELGEKQKSLRSKTYKTNQLVNLQVLQTCRWAHILLL